MIFKDTNFNAVGRVSQSMVDEMIMVIIEVHDTIKPNESLGVLDVADHLMKKGYRVEWHRINHKDYLWQGDVHPPMGS